MEALIIERFRIFKHNKKININNLKTKSYESSK